MFHTLVRKPKSSVELSFSVPWEALAPHIDRAAKIIAGNTKADGFRPGKVPVEVVRQKFSDLEILEQQLETVISQLYYEAVKAENLLTLGRPDVSIKKLAQGNPLEFQAATALVPKVEVAKYRELAVEPRTMETTKEEVEAALKELWSIRNRGTAEASETNSAERSESDQKTAPEQNAPSMSEVDAWDAFARTLGKFQNLEELRSALQQNIQSEKEYEESVRQENVLVELLIEKSEFEELPDILLASELDHVFHEFKHGIESKGIIFSDWLAGAKKSEEEFKRGLEPQALKRAKSSLLLREIAEQERLEPSEEEIREEIATLFRQYPDPRQQEELTKPEFAEYFRRALISKKTIAFLKELMVKKS